VLSISVIVDHISKSYGYGIFNKKYECILNDLCLKLDRGKTIGLLGPSGVGKTTLAKIMMGLETPTSGKIFINNIDIWDSKKEERSKALKKIQMLFQDTQGSLNPKKTIAKSLYETAILVGVKISDIDSKILEFLDIVGLSPDILCRYPHQISGGQNQRVALARILLLNPEYIILDEPTSALDIAVQAQIIQLLRNLQIKRNLGYLLISHNIPLIEFMASHIIYLDKGSVVFSGSTNKFREFYLNKEK